MEPRRRSDGRWGHGRRTNTLFFHCSLGGREADTGTGKKETARRELDVQLDSSDNDIHSLIICDMGSDIGALI